MKKQNHVTKSRGLKLIKFLVLIFAVVGFTFSSAQTQDLDVPYVPTPQPVVDKMLDMADVGPGDYVIDLGSGDGRIVISAVQRGAYGHGIDLDPERIKEARENAAAQDLGDEVMFLQENIFETDFSRASVITMYLLNSVNRKLRPHLLENLEPGTRIVSHSFNMGDWEPDQQVEVSPNNSSRSHDIYYWVIPARVDGNLSWQVNGSNVNVSVSQKYQNIDVTPGNSGWNISEETLHGKRISFKMSNGNTTHLYSGRVEDGEITGTVQIYEGENHSINQWNASLN